MAKIISFVNQKGGTGKTTACINLSASLVLKGKTVLLLDIDPQANSTLSLGVDPGHLNGSMYDVLLNHRELSDILQETTRDGLTLAPANIELANSNISLEGQQTRLRDALRGHKGQYDYILIDCPPSLSLLTVNGLVASDSVIIPVLCDYFSLEGLKQLLESIEKVRKGFNKALHVLGILPNMVDHRRNLTREVLSLLRANFKDLIFKEGIPVCVALAAAPSFGKDIFQYARWSAGGEAYRAVTREVIKRG
jgi:chromosome partitioning protein